MSLLNYLKTGNALLQMAVAPETRFRYELPYRTEMPEYYLGDNPYMDSMIYGAASLYSKDDERSKIAGRTATGRAGKRASKGYQDVYLKPFHAAEVIDPRLTDAKISSWTSVCKDDVLMRRLLSVFLRCEYHFTSAFQKDYFLDDLVANRKEFCSSLLVNIVLAYACVCFPNFPDRAEYWNPKALVYRFVMEAKRIWELENHVPRITTIQAGIVFNVFHNLCGLDEIGQPYRIRAIDLAHKMQLFDSTVGGRSYKMQRSMAFLAWTLFNWETLVGFSFMFTPLLKEPPNWALPDPSQDGKWYGEIWLKYPLTDTLSPSHFGNVFRAKSYFRIIMNEFCCTAYTEGSQVTVEKAYELLGKLKHWYYGLPSPLQPKTIVLPTHLQLHIYYHHLILTIFEPLMDTPTNQEPPPQQVVAESKKHLQTLIRLYYLRHGYDAMDLFIVIPLMLSGSDCIEAINDQTPAAELELLRSTLILVATGLYSQRRNHYLAEALFRVIRGRMRPSELSLLKNTMKIDESEWEEKSSMVQEVRSSWPVSVVKKKEELDSHILTNLVESYGNLNVEGNSSAQST
ncbi:Zn2Cys6 transcriptional regulator [Trichoderma guizhouense]|uniref:Zn2Cys6 transcriptional regulator n=1 Tax=Trichoderma guizhouense TaxID=1491466 RepID=A0A1T3CGV1_9HYPO|nr:Zn2Cys6 transcriptional regulator [Trichoderma guizhouense]